MRYLKNIFSFFPIRWHENVSKVDPYVQEDGEKQILRFWYPTSVCFFFLLLTHVNGCPLPLPLKARKWHRYKNGYPLVAHARISQMSSILSPSSSVCLSSSWDRESWDLFHATFYIGALRIRKCGQVLAIKFQINS